jgi:D-serine deaminase-like pyridoxal phosphate-dependent protein
MTNGSLLKTQLDTPALLVDLAQLERNIQLMADKAKAARVNLRPHAKAHKTNEIARRQVAQGAIGVAAAKIGEAEAMAQGGIRDIMITTPIIGAQKLDRVSRLAGEINLSLVLDSYEVATALSQMAQAAELELNVLVEVDTGLRRCGTEPGAPTAELAARVAQLPGLQFQGLKTAELQVYSASDQAHVANVEAEIGQALRRSVDAIQRLGLAVPTVCAGSTACADAALAQEVITEIQPGSYVFNSLDGVAPGAATLDDCAMTVLATVISRPAADRVVIDAGFKTLSRVNVPGMHGFGYVRPFGHAAVLERLYEEHGVIRLSQPVPVEIGMTVEVIPCSCSAVPNLFDEMVLTTGDCVTAVWPIEGRGRNR